jgi:hypothetical protein
MLVTNFRLKSLLYRIVCACYQLADIGRIHPARERSVRALQRTVDYIERAMPDAIGLESQRELIDYSLKAAPTEGHYLEFGVFTGGTIRYIARRIGGREMHGFDSFEGLPQAWSGFNLGRTAFDRRGRLPRVPANVRLHRGWFEDTVPQWLAANSGPLAFAHIDCDIYSSTRTVLSLMAKRIVPGTILLFDEYFNFPSWEAHEYKAFQELVTENRMTYRYLAFARQQVAVRIEAVGGGSP